MAKVKVFTALVWLNLATALLLGGAFVVLFFARSFPVPSGLVSELIKIFILIHIIGYLAVLFKTTTQRIFTGLSAMAASLGVGGFLLFIYLMFVNPGTGGLGDGVGRLFTIGLAYYLSLAFGVASILKYRR